MGKRSRKRASEGAVNPRRPVPPSAVGSGRSASPRHAAPLDRRARQEQAPPAPWSPFPLVELSILAGLICIVVGFLAGGSNRGLLLVLGFALVSISAVELSVREHFAGFRSHTTLLSAMLAIVPIVPLYVATSLPQVALLILGVVIFLVAFGVLRATFMRRTGGLGFRA